jgi:hypothetical protein
VGQVLLRLNEWISSVRNNGTEWGLGRIAGPGPADGQEIVRKIVDHLLADVHDAERDLLRKSLLETLLSLFALEPDLQRSMFADRLSRFLELEGGDALIRHFLSIHVFNLIWFQTMDSFRGLARTQDMFMKDMQNLEAACSDAVERSWKYAVPCSLDSDCVGRLLGDIENYIRGGSASNSPTAER